MAWTGYLREGTFRKFESKKRWERANHYIGLLTTELQLTSKLRVGNFLFQVQSLLTRTITVVCRGSRSSTVLGRYAPERTFV